MTSESLLLLNSEKTPRVQRAGILVAPIEGGPFAEGTDPWVHGCLALADPELEAMPVETWLRSLLVLGVSRSNQFMYTKEILGDRVVFPDEIHERKNPDGTVLKLLPFNIQILKSLGLSKAKETYHIQIKCLYLSSDVFEIQCA